MSTREVVEIEVPGTRELVEIEVPGPQGSPGPAGPGGPPGSEFLHTQPSPASIWTCETGLDYPRQPMVFLDEDPQVPVLADVRNLGNGTIQIDFGSPKTGRAYF